MEDENQIQLIGIKPNKSLFRFVERHIEKWISRERSLLFLPNRSSYRVTIEREADHCYFCHLQVTIGPRTWESYANERTFQEALLHAIRQLKTPFIPPLSQKPNPHLLEVVA